MGGLRGHGLVVFGLFLFGTSLLGGAVHAQFTPPAPQKLTGAQLFTRQCGTCHVIDASAGPRQGPPLGGVIGRKAGGAPGFKYSPALANADFTWDEAKLDAFIANPQAVVQGAVMPYRQANADIRKEIVAYLKEQH